MSKKIDSDSQNAWYTLPGLNEDVVISSRARLARNLANFPFPQRFNGDDGAHVQSLVFDAFNHFEDGDSYQSIAVAKLDQLGSRILQERGVLENTSAKDSGIIIRNDGRIYCSVNIIDHIRISSFASGYSLDSTLQNVKAVDGGLEKHMQFAASYDFGYLTAGIFDAGSGQKLSYRLHLPCLSLLGRIGEISRESMGMGLELKACFGSGEKSSALGFYYQLTTFSAVSGSEFDQMAVIAAYCATLMDRERSARKECSKKLITSIKDLVFRSIAIVRVSSMISLKEAVEIAGNIKLGLNLKLVDGIAQNELNSLLYRIQDGNIQFVLENGNFKFEKDIVENKEKKNQRLRALILQEAIENITVS